MPPRKTAKKAPARKGIVDVVEPTAATVSNQVAYSQKMMAEALLARIGWALLKFDTFIKIFGKWNNRDLNEPHVKALSNDMEIRGVYWLLTSTALPVILQSSDMVDMETVFQEKDIQTGMPFLKWSTSDTPEIEFAGGHHRHEAHERFKAKLEKEIEQLRAQLERWGNKETLTAEDNAAINAARTECTTKIGILKGLGRWLGVLYDGSKLSEECKIWLSNNQDKAELGETDEETLAKTVRLLLEAYGEDRGSTHHKLEACRAVQEEDLKSSRTAKTQRMLSHITYTVMLMDAAKWGQHFRGSFLFKPTIMHDRVIKVHAGVLARLTRTLSRRLDILLVPVKKTFRPTEQSPDLLVDHFAMLEFLNMRNDNEARTEWEAATGQQWNQYLVGMMDTVEKCAKDPHIVDRKMFATTSFLDMVDDAFSDIWDDGSMVGRPGSEAYLEQLMEYAERCCNSATTIFSLDNDDDDRGQGDIYLQLRSKILLMSASRPGSTLVPLPLFTKSCLRLINDELSKYPEALKEVSRWFEPLIDVIILHYKSTSLHDYTTMALLALAKMKTISNPDLAQDLVAMTLFMYRTTDVQALETELGNNPLRLASHDMYFRKFTTFPNIATPNIITINNIVDPERVIGDIQTVMMKAMATSGYKPDQPAKSFKALVDNSYAKPLLHSSYNFQWESKSAKRECYIVAMASIIESLYSSTVRRPMLKTQANRLRHILCKPLEPVATGQFFITQDGVKFIRFWDEIYTPLAEVVDSARNVVLAAAAQEKARAIKSLQEIITKIASSPGAILTSARLAENRKVMPEEVSKALKGLVSAMELNITRTFLRSTVSMVEPFFADTEIATHPFILPPTVADMDTYPRRPDDAAVAALRGKAVEGKKQAQLDFTAAEDVRKAAVAARRKGKAKATDAKAGDAKGKAPAIGVEDFIVEDSDDDGEGDFQEVLKRSRVIKPSGQTSGQDGFDGLLSMFEKSGSSKKAGKADEDVHEYSDSPPLDLDDDDMEGSRAGTIPPATSSDGGTNGPDTEPDRIRSTSGNVAADAELKNSSDPNADQDVDMTDPLPPPPAPPAPPAPPPRSDDVAMHEGDDPRENSPLSSIHSDVDKPSKPRVLTAAEKKAEKARKTAETKKKNKAARDALKAAGAPSKSGSEASVSTRKSREAGKRPGPSGPSGHSPPQKRIKSRTANDASDDDDEEILEEANKGQWNA